EGARAVPIQLIEHVGAIEVTAHAVEFLPQSVTILQPIELDACGQAELACELQAIDRSVSGTKVPRFPDISLPGRSQSDECGKIRVIAPTEPRDDRAHRGVPRTILAVVGSPRQWVSRLHRDGGVVAGFAIDGPQEGELPGDRSLERQMFAECHPWDAG